ncbi:MAG TPA: phospholipid carrier-dependent glycosyltransferase [Segeticoccus sp.]|uniref:dolichyl-phosphate-mannose--protein mannosyltransferase n=1 Tax=Segeticoccus sp. TaxID=2706531 RepID=UPI002D7F1FF2|nr:phospholipid carrier-dependent glycosyltransferase [Segeticoccus sp.]HET8600423.1 phospholipid carrier-dependent glycosyltransferase [Segeticoccus sp.]
MAAGAATERLRERLLGPRPSRHEVLWAWLGPLIAMAVGGFLRFWHLGRPHQLVFDETYYVKQAYSFIRYGDARATLSNLKTPDALFTHGDVNVYGNQPEMLINPPVGRWVVASGEKLFGIDSSFGWRFGVCVLGTLAILLVGRAAWRLFGSATLATVASVLLALEGNEFVHSRTSLLDTPVMFFALAGFCSLLVDRHRSRELLAQKVGAIWESGGSPPTGSGRRAYGDLQHGPWLGWRPWTWVAGVCLGLSTGSKWSGVFFLAAFGLMRVLWDMGARRTVGIRHWWRGGLVKDGLFAFVALVPVALATYLASYTGWFLSSGGYDRQWAQQHPSAHVAWVPDALRSLWQYHVEVYRFNVGLTTPHTYQSNPWSWMIQGRPTSFFYEGPKLGHDGCMVQQCSKAITNLGTPSIWWGATAGLAVLLFMWALRRDWRAGAILAGVAAGWLPWFHWQQRTIFTFYVVAFVPYVVLVCTYCLGLVIGPTDATPERRRWGMLAAGSFLVLTAAMFVFFYPIWTAQVIPFSHWQWRMWFPSWV